MKITKTDQVVNEKVLDFANKISRTKRGARDEIKPDYPEYKILEPVVTTAMAEVGVCLELRKHQNAEEISKLCHKSLEETSRLLDELGDAGAAFFSTVNGVKEYWLEVWVPGHMELMANHRENVRKFPQIAQAFNDYGIRKGPMGLGVFPVGTGPMRVIPIETAISGDTRHASYEEVSKYLNENELFSVSDCSCRASREALGEGCGHLKEDMCIQLGHAAEYYIETGRGRKIDRTEAFDIIKRAEENGLMHSIPNLDGPGETHAICNCCGCSCFAVRIAGMYNNNDMMRSNYVAKIDTEKCVGCGECVEVCPVNATKLGQKLCTIDPLPEFKMKEFPDSSEWKEEMWNVDYRINRKNVLDSGTSPCKTQCPAHISVQGYIKLAAMGKYREALELIKHENPFPAVCGRICPRLCEDECTRQDIDDPVAVDDIKKFIAAQDLKEEYRFVPKIKHDYKKKIAVIGAGPSGLSCAYYLAVDGYKVTVFEREEKLGGMLTLGIPSYRLEKDVIEAEIDVLRELGVTFKCGVNVGEDITIEELRKDGFEAFYLAIGASNGRNLPLKNSETKNIVTGVQFLKDVNLGKLHTLTGHTLVLGGGNVAVDVARSALRLGSEKVTMCSLEEKKMMPAFDEEIIEAEAEGVEFLSGYGPQQFMVENGVLKGIEVKKCLSTLNEKGQFSPVYDEKDLKTVVVDNIIIAVGQSIDWGNLLKGEDVKLNPTNTVIAHKQTLQTSVEDIFAGGDVVTGPNYAISAIAMGKEAAVSIHRFVHVGQSLVYGRDNRIFKALDKTNLDLQGYDPLIRQRIPHENPEFSKKTFLDLRGTFTEEQMLKETNRCLGCGVSTVDEYLCLGCGACTTRCKFDAIHLEKVYDKQGVTIKELKPIVMKAMVKRKGKIALKKVKKGVTGIFVKR